jgi:hypothetical protein
MQGLTTHPSMFSSKETAERITSAIEARGIPLVARVDPHGPPHALPQTAFSSGSLHHFVGDFLHCKLSCMTFGNSEKTWKFQ